MFTFGLPVKQVLGMAVIESVLIGVLGTLLGVAGGFVLLHWLINSLFATTFPDSRDRHRARTAHARDRWASA